MKLTSVTLNRGPAQTGKQMRYLVENYFMDMAPWASLSFPEIFEKIKNIPFRFDPTVMEKDPDTGGMVPTIQEFVKRPLFTINRIGPGGDCDDKAIAIAAWAKLHNYPYRFIACGVKVPEFITIPLTHVFAEVKIDNRWVRADCTYRFNQLGWLNRHYDRFEVI